MNSHLQDLVLTAVMTAVICVVGPFAVPIGPVPITMVNLIIPVTLYILGWKRGTISVVMYILIGLVGLPVFSGFGSGAAKLFGPTGGYIIAYIFMALLAGIVIEKVPGKYVLHLIAIMMGNGILYLFGSLWLAYQAKLTLMQAMAAGVFPFILGDCIKSVMAVIIGPILQTTLKKAHVIR